MYLLAPFILQSFKKIIRANPELWVVIFLGTPFSGPKWPICPEQIFLVQAIISFIYLLSLLTVQNLKKFLQQIQRYGPLAPNNFF